MMVCSVCGGEIPAGTVCPACAFDESRNYEKYGTIAPVQGAKSIAALRADWDQARRRRDLDQLQIGLGVYHYALEEEALTLERGERLLLAGGKDLAAGEIVWSQAVFPGIAGMACLPVELYLWREPGAERRVRVTVDHPGGDGPWRVGLKRTERDQGILVVGTQEDYAESDPFPLEI